MTQNFKQIGNGAVKLLAVVSGWRRDVAHDKVFLLC